MACFGRNVCSGVGRRTFRCTGERSHVKPVPSLVQLLVPSTAAAAAMVRNGNAVSDGVAACANWVSWISARALWANCQLALHHGEQHSAPGSSASREVLSVVFYSPGLHVIEWLQAQPQLAQPCSSKFADRFGARLGSLHTIWRRDSSSGVDFGTAICQSGRLIAGWTKRWCPCSTLSALAQRTSLQWCSEGPRCVIRPVEAVFNSIFVLWMY